MRYTEAQVSSEALDQPEFQGIPRKVFVCSTPRSGSYMLCRYMINAGIGVPHEYFNPVIMRQMGSRLGLDNEMKGLKWKHRTIRDRLPLRNQRRIAEEVFLQKYISVLVPRRCQNGIFAAKIHYDQYFNILDNGTGRRLLDGGLFVYLYREDLLRQTISRNFSYVTGKWGIDDAVTTTPMPQADFLDPAGIDRELETLADEDRAWRVFLARNDLGPLSISFEQLCADPARFVTAIAMRLGLEPTSVRHGYDEAGERPDTVDAGLPSKSDVAAHYLNARRRLRGYAKESSR